MKGRKDDNSNKSNKNFHEGHRQRMRERFDADPEMMTFQEHELLEYILNTVIVRKDTNALAHELIHRCGSLYSVFSEPVQDLLKVKNMTVSAAYLIAGLVPIMRKALRNANEMSMQKIINYGDAADYFHTYFLARNTECLCILYLNVNFSIIKTEVVDDLNPKSVTLNVRNIAASAIKHGGSYILIGHNHPSGSPIPSENDLMLFWNLFNALSELDIGILDNFIFTADGFLSFRNVGIMDKFAIEYERKRPTKSLRENNVHTSFYLSNLKQYLVDVTKLKEQNLIELVTIQEFIDKNKLKINDYRVPKQGSSDNSDRKPIGNEKFDIKTEVSSELPLTPDVDTSSMDRLIKRAAHGDMPVQNRNKLTTVKFDELFSSNASKQKSLPVVDREEQWEKAVEVSNNRRRAKGESEDEILNVTNDENRIPASTRNIPVYVKIKEEN